MLGPRFDVAAGSQEGRGFEGEDEDEVQVGSEAEANKQGHQEVLIQMQRTGPRSPPPQLLRFFHNLGGAIAAIETVGRLGGGPVPGKNGDWTLTIRQGPPG